MAYMTLNAACVLDSSRYLGSQKPHVGLAEMLSGHTCFVDISRVLYQPLQNNSKDLQKRFT